MNDTKIEIQQEILNDMIAKIIQLDENNNTNFYKDIIVESIKVVPVSIIEVTDENKEFLTKKFNFTKSEYGANASIKVGETDNVQNYSELTTYFDEKSVLRSGVSIMVQDDKDIYLTEKKPTDLGYSPNNSFDKINLPVNNNDSFNLNDLMVVQTKNVTEQLIKMDSLFNVYSKTMIDFIKNPQDCFINTGKIQQLNKDGFMVVKKNKISQIVNEENGFAKGYMPKEKLIETQENVNNSNIYVFDKKLEFKNNYTNKTYDISTLNEEEKEFLDEQIKDIRIANNFLLKNPKDNKYINMKSKCISNIVSKFEKYLKVNEFIKEINTAQTLITFQSNDKVGFVKSRNEPNKYMIPKTSIYDYDLVNETRTNDAITKFMYKRTDVEISNDSLDLLDKVETQKNYFENIYQTKVSKKDTEKVLSNNKNISFFSYDEIKEMLKNDSIRVSSLIALEKLFKEDLYFSLRIENDEEMKNLIFNKKKQSNKLENNLNNDITYPEMS